MRRPGREAPEVVEQRLRRRTADQAEDRDERDQRGKQRDDPVVRQSRGPVGQVVVGELGDRPPEDARPGALREVPGLLRVLGLVRPLLRMGGHLRTLLTSETPGYTS